MALMIPSIISPEVRSTAERRVFDWFKNAPLTEHWIVLHSLGISSHKTLMYGETDFFVLAPGLGVFALEVKGGRVRRTQGIWHFTNRYGETTSKARGPFDQAKDGVFSIISALKTRLDSNHKHLERVLFGYGVIFPDIEYNSDGIDEEQWQVFDARNAHHVREFILELSKKTIKKKESIYGSSSASTVLTREDVKYLASILRGDFDFAVSLKMHIQHAEEAIIRLTNEQYKCLDQIEDNPRCLIQGAAGTGKTLIAIDEVKRSVADGKRTALFCYNTKLAEWLVAYFEMITESLRPAYVGTFHKFMYQVVNNSPEYSIYRADESSDSFFSSELPLAASIILDNSMELFDKIIVDEAQDLISDNYLLALDACLKKGIERGNWSFYGDFSRQAIYSEGLSANEMFSLLNKKTMFIKFTLKQNCRNTRPISDEIRTVTGFNTTTEGWTNIEGVPVEYHTYTSLSEQEDKLRKLLNHLQINRVSQEKITILSPRIRENSVVSLLNDINIVDYSPYAGNRISFSTIQGFKGLENSVIILVDVESFSPSALLYVGLSRAKTSLYIFETMQAVKEYQRLFERRILGDE